MEASDGASSLVPPTHCSCCPQLWVLGKIKFAMSRMFTLVLILWNKAFYGWKGHMDSTGNQLLCQDGKSQATSHLRGIAQISASIVLWKIQDGDFHHFLMENLHRADAKFVMYVSSLWGRGQVPMHACVVSRQPWGLLLRPLSPLVWDRVSHWSGASFLLSILLVRSQWVSPSPLLSQFTPCPL